MAEKLEPTTEAFLELLSKDMVVRPGGVRPLDERRSRQINRLVRGVQVEDDAPLCDQEGQGIRGPSQS
jgi:hypothetical protein